MKRFLIALLAVVVASLGSGYFLSRGNLFRLKDVRVEGATSEVEAKVLAVTTPYMGRGLLGISLEELQDKVQSLIQIAEVKVHRRLPSQLTIKISTRKPVAFFWSSKLEAFILIDGKGHEMETLPRAMPLPMIESDSHDGLRSTALFLEELKQDKEVGGVLAYEDVDFVRWDRVRGLTVIDQDLGLEVELGWGMFLANLARARTAYRRLHDRNVQASWMDASSQTRVVARR